eukprot:SM000018S03704  [mRNA]  locus=s18:941558:942422:+ [translate_table: standard]
MARAPAPCLLLLTVLAATTTRAAARASLTGSVFCDRDFNGIMDSPWPQTDRLYHGCLSRPDTPAQGALLQLECVYQGRGFEMFYTTTNSMGSYSFDNDLPTYEDGYPGSTPFYRCSVSLSSSGDINCRITGSCGGGDVGAITASNGNKSASIRACQAVKLPHTSYKRLVILTCLSSPS